MVGEAARATWLGKEWVLGKERKGQSAREWERRPEAAVLAEMDSHTPHLKWLLLTALTSSKLVPASSLTSAPLYPSASFTLPLSLLRGYRHLISIVFETPQESAYLPDRSSEDLLFVEGLLRAFDITDKVNKSRATQLLCAATIPVSQSDPQWVDILTKMVDEHQPSHPKSHDASLQLEEELTKQIQPRSKVCVMEAMRSRAKSMLNTELKLQEVAESKWNVTRAQVQGAEAERENAQQDCKILQGNMAERQAALVSRANSTLSTTLKATASNLNTVTLESDNTWQVFQML
ncbi:hypothetical protein HDU93_008803 [Gonapodya sp. JEL0774]|nr:hypothetical protein HDU93_008803 [Gonapodya sp. JEL0774]